eukprot:366574-Chlamydomonas_euryale.AAC.1
MLSRVYVRRAGNFVATLDSEVCRVDGAAGKLQMLHIQACIPPETASNCQQLLPTAGSSCRPGAPPPSSTIRLPPSPQPQRLPPPRACPPSGCCRREPALPAAAAALPRTATRCRSTSSCPITPPLPLPYLRVRLPWQRPPVCCPPPSAQVGGIRTPSRPKTLSNPVGDCFVVNYNDRNYELEVREAKPADAISVVETDCQVDFEAPKDYKEPEKVFRKPAAAAAAAAGSGAGAAAGSASGSGGGGGDAKEAEPQDPKFLAFAGPARRLDGKAPTLPSAPVPVALPGTSGPAAAAGAPPQLLHTRP